LGVEADIDARPDHPTNVPPNLTANSSAIVGKAPQHVIAIMFMSMPDVRHLNAALVMKCMHRVQPLAKAVRWHGDFHNERKVAAIVLPPGLPL